MKSAKFTTREVDSFLSKTKTQFIVPITPQPNQKKYSTSKFQVGDELYCKEKVDQASKDSLIAQGLSTIDFKAYDRNTEAASRCILLIAEVTARRVEDLTEEDCIAEGFISAQDETAREQFSKAWKAKYEDLEYGENMWCWVYKINAVKKD